MKVVMLGADRSVKGGVSAVVNNLYEAGLDQRIDLTYIGTMVDGSAAAKLLKGVQALLKFVAVLPKADIVHLNMAADASCYRKLIFMQIALWFHKKVVIHEHGGDFQGFYYKRCSAKRQAYIKKMLNRADLFLVLTDVWKDFFADMVDRDKIHVLQNAVPVPKMPKTDYSSHTAVFLGRLCPEKGVDELLDCVEAVWKKHPDFHLVLGGFWENGTEELQKKAKKLEAQEQKYSAELDKALAEYADLKALAADFDPVELYEARQVIRPVQKKEVEQQLEGTMHEKPSLIMLLSAKQETSRLLGEDAENRQARQMIMRRRSTEQLKRSHLKTDRCKIER